MSKKKQTRLSDIDRIEDPVERFVKASRLIQKMEEQEKLLATIRNLALLEARELKITQTTLAALTGISKQRVQQLEERARTLHPDITPPWDRVEREVKSAD